MGTLRSTLITNTLILVQDVSIIDRQTCTERLALSGAEVSHNAKDKAPPTRSVAGDRQRRSESVGDGDRI
jgi:hypothetical protein